MSSVLYPDLKTTILNQNNDPGAITGMMISLLEEALFTEGVLVADPGQPLPFLIESNVVLTTSAIESYETLNQRAYPLMANDENQLYNHLTDKNYRDMFASPGLLPIELWVSEEEIIRNALPIPGSSTRKLTIGKHTVVRANGINFTLQYPINFLVKSHNAIEVVYDGTKPSHLQTLPGNKINVRMVKTRNTGGSGDVVRHLIVPITFPQMTLVSNKEEADVTQVFKRTYTFTDKFFACRAFKLGNNNEWAEIHTTHSEQVYNITKPTLLLKVINQTLTVELPHIYVLSGQLTGTFRVDIYTTRGDLYESFEGVSPDSIIMTFNDLDNDEGGVYTSPMTRLSTISLRATSVPLNGGRDQPSFTERRDRVLRNTVYDNIMPISNAQVETTLKDLGFDSTMNIDTLTERTYLATKEMPINTSGLSSTGVDTAMMTMRITFEDLVQYDTVKDNDIQITVMPDTLYRDILGALEIIPDNERIIIDQMSGEELVNKLVGDTYLTSPLHYVLDPADNSFEARPYFLTQPTIDVTSFIASNDGIDALVSASTDMSIEYTDSGYLIRVRTDSNAAYKAIPDASLFVQLAFIPEGDSSYTYLNGTLLVTDSNGERIFEFMVNTNWQITKEHKLLTLGFSRPGSAPPSYETPLEGRFSLIWGALDYPGPQSDVDDVLGYHLLSSTAKGIYHEELLIKLGDELTGLWARSRAFMSARKFKTHEFDVQGVYENNVYHLNPATNLPEVIKVDGVMQLHIKHRVGDLMFEEDGVTPFYAVRAGSPVYINGELILESDRKTERWWEVALFDAAYRYTTRESDKTYFNNIPNILTTWINTTLGGLNDLLERTDLYFHPKNTLRYFDVLVDDTEVTTIYGSQRFVLTLFVSNQVYRNVSLRTTLESAAVRAVVRALDTDRVTRLGVEDAVKAALGDDAISVVLEGLGSADRPARVVTILDETNRLTIRKRPSLEPDGSIAIRDAVEVVFLRHTPT